MASKDELRAALDTLSEIVYCWDSETLGLGRCQCNSHSVFSRKDGRELSENDKLNFYNVIREVDANT